MFVSSTQPLCHSDQRDALLEFKNEFVIKKPYWADSNISSSQSWVNKSDCCSWDGVTCDATSGKVIGLDLSSGFFYGHLNSSSSLFKLRHLRNLNLAGNNFSNSLIPAEFDKLMGLERLDLSYSSFSGQIPTNLLHLTKLVSLHLSFSDDIFPYSPKLWVDESFLHLLAQNLRNLRELDLNSLNISSEIPHEFSNLQFLRSLYLEDCNLFGEFPNSVLLMPSLESIRLSQNPNLRGNLPVFGENNSLLELTIRYTSFSGPIPNSIGSLKHLTFLSLSYSNFLGKIPFSLGNLSHLSFLSLSGNNLVGEIPSSIVNLKQLTSFDVSNNKLSGILPASIFNSTQLRSIRLNSNQFRDSPPPIISQISKLESFSADDNSFTGAILSSLVKIPSLTRIILSSTQFNDFTGIWNISLLPNLQDLEIGNKNDNKFGLVDFNAFSTLKKLEELDISGIPLSMANITSNSDFPSHLTRLVLINCNIIEFPPFIRYGRNLRSVDLSNNKMEGQVPDWLWRLPNLQYVDLSNNSLSSFSGSLKASPESDLAHLDLSSNAFQGPLFIPSMSLTYFSGSKNNFTGGIPRSLCGLSSLSILDLSKNNLHGSIPWCFKFLMSSLSDINLRNNRLSGSIPEIFMNATSLYSLDVSHNRMEGKLPYSLIGCSYLQVLNVGNNKINDIFPFHLNSLKMLQVLVLRSNKFRGKLYNVDGGRVGFPLLKIVDVSHNDFFGTLPSDYFLNWTVMSSKTDDNMTPHIQIPQSAYKEYYISFVLMIKGVSMEMERVLTTYTAVDFSGNQLHGQIPDSVGLLKELLILNLSSNAFTGHIPSSFANLTNLESLDISQNNISGEIPPRSLCGLSSLWILDLSNNNLHGSIPWCLKSLMSHLSDLNLRNNSLSGSLPEIFMNATRLQSLDVSQNQMEGKLPYTLIGCSSLQVLNVGNNKINDIFPFHLNSLQKLQVLVLRSNKFHGTLHNSDGGWVGFHQLKIIDVSHNDFFGTLPCDYFLNWTVMSSKTDNNMKPQYIQSSNANYYSLVLMIKGVSMEMERILTTYTAVDFSGNQLHGQIPDSAGQLKELHILNLSSNAFIGHIPSSFANLTNLESLDLSQNNISGEIPPELGTLSSLAWINVSHNQLEGSIPQGTQFQTQKCSSYEGNPKLNTFSLKNVCGDINPNGVEIEEDNEEEEESVINWVAASIGFGPGIVFGITMGYIVGIYKHQ